MILNTGIKNKHYTTTNDTKLQTVVVNISVREMLHRISVNFSAHLAMPDGLTQK